MRRPRRELGSIVLLLVVGVATLVAYAVFDVYLFRCEPVSSADAALVLGTLVQHGEPSPSFKGRLDAGAELFRQGIVRAIAVSGAVTSPGEPSEAEAGALYLEKQGIPGDRIIVEPRARSTYENLVFGAQEFSKRHVATWVMVTDPYHLRRATLLAERAHLPAKCVAVEHSTRRSLSFLVSETMKVARLRLSR